MASSPLRTSRRSSCSPIKQRRPSVSGLAYSTAAGAAAPAEAFPSSSNHGHRRSGCPHPPNTRKSSGTTARERSSGSHRKRSESTNANANNKTCPPSPVTSYSSYSSNGHGISHQSPSLLTRRHTTSSVAERRRRRSIGVMSVTTCGDLFGGDNEETASGIKANNNDNDSDSMLDKLVESRGRRLSLEGTSRASQKALTAFDTAAAAATTTTTPTTPVHLPRMRRKLQMERRDSIQKKQLEQFVRKSTRAAEVRRARATDGNHEMMQVPAPTTRAAVMERIANNNNNNPTTATTGKKKKTRRSSIPATSTRAVDASDEFKNFANAFVVFNNSRVDNTHENDHEDGEDTDEKRYVVIRTPKHLSTTKRKIPSAGSIKLHALYATPPSSPASTSHKLQSSTDVSALLASIDHDPLCLPRSSLRSLEMHYFSKKNDLEMNIDDAFLDKNHFSCSDLDFISSLLEYESDSMDRRSHKERESVPMASTSTGKKKKKDKIKKSTTISGTNKKKKKDDKEEKEEETSQFNSSNYNSLLDDILAAPNKVTGDKTAGATLLDSSSQIPGLTYSSSSLTSATGNSSLSSLQTPPDLQKRRHSPKVLEEEEEEPPAIVSPRSHRLSLRRPRHRRRQRRRRRSRSLSSQDGCQRRLSITSSSDIHSDVEKELDGFLFPPVYVSQDELEASQDELENYKHDLPLVDLSMDASSHSLPKSFRCLQQHHYQPRYESIDGSLRKLERQQQRENNDGDEEPSLSWKLSKLMLLRPDNSHGRKHRQDQDSQQQREEVDLSSQFFGCNTVSSSVEAQP